VLSGFFVDEKLGVDEGVEEKEISASLRELSNDICLQANLTG